MPAALQCPDCGHQEMLDNLGGVATFRCGGCGRALKVPAQFRQGPNVRPTDPRPESPAERTQALPKLPPVTPVDPVTPVARGNPAAAAGTTAVPPGRGLPPSAAAGRRRRRAGIAAASTDPAARPLGRRAAARLVDRVHAREMVRRAHQGAARGHDPAPGLGSLRSHRPAASLLRAGDRADRAARRVRPRAVAGPQSARAAPGSPAAGVRVGLGPAPADASARSGSARDERRPVARPRHLVGRHGRQDRRVGARRSLEAQRRRGLGQMAGGDEQLVDLVACRWQR